MYNQENRLQDILVTEVEHSLTKLLSRAVNGWLPAGDFGELTRTLTKFKTSCTRVHELLTTPAGSKATLESVSGVAQAFTTELSKLLDLSAKYRMQ